MFYLLVCFYQNFTNVHNIQIRYNKNVIWVTQFYAGVLAPLTICETFSVISF